MTAPSIATATVIAEVNPIVATDGMPAINRPARLTTTVVPANSTAVPDMALASAAASTGERPAATYSR